jgi:hemolysin activation/secretion protein
VGYIVGGLLVHVGPGDLSGTPSTNTLFTEANTPGLTQQSNFLTGTTTVRLDLSRPGFSEPEGLQLEANDSQFFDQSGNQANFHLLETQATYYSPITNGMRTLVFRVRNETAFPEDHQVVPFYLQPTLGGPDDLRGYDRYRFYANGNSVATVEYRWSISQMLEMAIFGDGGNVYVRPGLIGFRDLHGDGGFGFRIKNKQVSIMRFDVGFSPEGVHVWFVFNDIFGKFSRIF